MFFSNKQYLFNCVSNMGQNESKNSKNYQQEMAINTQIHFIQQQQAQMSINPNVNSKKPIQFIKQGTMSKH